MDWQKAVQKAKKVVEQRGGSESVKADAREVKDILKGEGTMSEKLKEAAAAVKEPGAHKPAKPADGG